MHRVKTGPLSQHYKTYAVRTSDRQCDLACNGTARIARCVLIWAGVMHLRRGCASELRKQRQLSAIQTLAALPIEDMQATGRVLGDEVHRAGKPLWLRVNHPFGAVGLKASSYLAC